MLGLVRYQYIKNAELTTNQLLTQIKSRGSRARGDVKDAVRSKLVATYGFVISDNKKTVRHNRQKHDDLLEDSAFHYKVRLSLFWQ
jgi:hypothetical protein